MSTLSCGMNDLVCCPWHAAVDHYLLNGWFYFQGCHACQGESSQGSTEAAAPPRCDRQEEESARWWRQAQQEAENRINTWSKRQRCTTVPAVTPSRISCSFRRCLRACVFIAVCVYVCLALAAHRSISSRAVVFCACVFASSEHSPGVLFTTT